MILKLLRTDLRSDRLLILLASLVSVLLWLSEAGRFEPQFSTLATLIYGQFPFLILFGVIEIRDLNQKRRRLLAQLPVSGTAVRISRWLSLLPVIAIACLISAVILTFYPPVPRWGWGGFVATGALMIAGFVSLAALMRIFWLGMFMRSPVKFIVWSAELLVLLFLRWQLLLLFGGEGPFRADAIIRWDLLVPAALGFALVLMAVDIVLDRLVDNRLG